MKVISLSLFLPSQFSLRREQNLNDDQRFRLRDLLRYNLKTVRAYLLKEAFQQLWDYNSPTWAGKFLDEMRARSRSRSTSSLAITHSVPNSGALSSGLLMETAMRLSSVAPSSESG